MEIINIVQILELGRVRVLVMFSLLVQLVSCLLVVGDFLHATARIDINSKVDPRGPISNLEGTSSNVYYYQVEVLYTAKLT